MRNTLFLLSALVLTSPIASAQDTVTFTYQPAKVKSKQVLSNTQAQNMTMNINVTMDGAVMGTMNAENVTSRTKTAVIRKWKPKKRMLLLEYTDNGSFEKQTTPDGEVVEKPKANSLAGKAFALKWTAKTDEVSITTPEGDLISEEERKLVLKDWKALPMQRSAGPLEKLLSKGPISVGDELPFDQETLSEMMSMDEKDEFDLQNPKLIFKEVREHAGVPCGVFAMSMTMVGNENQMSMTMNMAGEFIVGIDNLQLHELKMGGPLTLAAEQTRGEKTMVMNGQGEAAFSINRTYAK